MIILVISLCAVWQGKKLVDLYVYNSILTEKSFYFERQSEWFQYNLNGNHRKVAFPNKFQAITALNFDNEVIWIGTIEESDDSTFLAEYDPKYNDCTVLCSGNALEVQRLELSTITEFHFQPKTKRLSFLSGNDLYLYNGKEKRYNKIKSKILKTSSVFGKSMTWIDEETIVYINAIDHKLYKYNYVSKEETYTDIWSAAAINGFSPGNNSLIFLTGDTGSFGMLQFKLCSVNTNSWTKDSIYKYYGDQQIFGFDDTTRGILYMDYSFEEKKLYFTQCEKLKYAKRLSLDLEQVDNIVWPISSL